MRPLGRFRSAHGQSRTQQTQPFSPTCDTHMRIHHKRKINLKINKKPKAKSTKQSQRSQNIMPSISLPPLILIT